MNRLLVEDPRVDLRIKATLGQAPLLSVSNVENRQQLLDEANTPEAIAAREQFSAVYSKLVSEDMAASTGLDITTHQFVSTPDNNNVNIQLIKPQSTEPLPCVYYIHGGAMQTWSCFDEICSSWGRTIAQQGVAVAMIDFRNCLIPSSAKEVAPYPAGLNDCVAGLKWLVDQSSEFNIDSQRIIVAGDSGGGNLTLATGLKLKQMGELNLIQGLYALCPFIAGQWPQEKYPSSIENNGLALDLHSNRSAMAYGIEAFEQSDPLAWPAFASEDDVRGLVPTIIRVNECDPLRDEGVAFYRLLLKAGVSARCHVAMGTTHAIELFSAICPDISCEAAASIAHFCREA